MPAFLHCITAGTMFLAASLGSSTAAAQATEQQINVRLLEFSKQKDEARARKMVEEGAALNSRTRSGETPLLLWVKAGNLDMVAWLIAKGANVNQEALDKTTPLMTAAFAGRVDLMRALLDGGAEIDRQDQVFKTAMVYAAGEGQVEAVKLFLDRGVDVNHLYNHNLTALMWAAGYGKVECVELLLERGADPKLRDERGKTASDIAHEQGHQALAAMLRERAG